MTNRTDAIALLATDKLDVGSGSATPGLFNAFKRGLPIQIVTEKTSMLPPTGPGSGGLLVRTDLKDQIKTVADLKGKRIAVNNIQSTTLNYVMRGISKGGLSKDDVTFVEMPFNQFVPAMEKKAVDAVMAYPPLLQTLEDRMKLGVRLPEADLYKTSEKDSTNIMLFSSGFAKTDVPHFKQMLVEQICQASGGPCTYTGKDMKTAHQGMNITDAQFNALVEDLVKSLDKFKVGEREKNDLLGALGGMKGDIVGQ